MKRRQNVEILSSTQTDPPNIDPSKRKGTPRVSNYTVYSVLVGFLSAINNSHSSACVAVQKLASRGHDKPEFQYKLNGAVQSN